MKKVILGMSGGVDSSVAAILLKQNYEVIGVTFKFVEDDVDAEMVCAKLGIKHYVVDYSKEFKRLVIDSFLEDYKNAITPNPCVLCNKYVKMQFLYNEMKKMNCDYMATGHYAKWEDSKLLCSTDLAKDQTYFLSLVSKEILEHTLFPLEGMTKEEVRKIALDYSLDVANKKDSTDICFVNDKFKNYITTNIKNDKGSIINVETREKIGIHNGLSYYTIGQRRGLDLGGNKDRMFVVRKDIVKNILYVGEDKYLYSNACLIERVNWLGDKKTVCQACFRYHQPKTNVKLEYMGENILVRYDKVKSVTIGQVCVFYDNNVCLGGGIIKEIYQDDNKLWYLN